MVIYPLCGQIEGAAVNIERKKCVRLAFLTLAIRTTVVPITPLIGTTVLRISGVIRTTGKSNPNVKNVYI